MLLSGLNLFGSGSNPQEMIEDARGIRVLPDKLHLYYKMRILPIKKMPF
jgi:hypothetical protein